MLVPSSSLFEEPEKEGCEPIEDRLGAEREIDRLMMLDSQIAVQIREADGEQVAIEMRGKTDAGFGAEAHVARRAASDRGSKFALDDQTQTLKRRQPVGDDRAAELGFALDLDAGRRGARTNEREDGREASAPGFERTGAPDAAAGDLRVGSGWRQLLIQFAILSGQTVPKVWTSVSIAPAYNNFPAKVADLSLLFPLT